MDVECHHDCNVVSKRTAAKEHVTWMLHLDQVDCSTVFKNMRLKNSFINAGSPVKEHFYEYWIQ